jgi:hypothetical protein
MSASFAVPANLHSTKTEENGSDGQSYSIKAGLAQMLKVCLYLHCVKFNFSVLNLV